MQARLFFHIFSQKIKGTNILPKPEIMIKEIEAKENVLKAYFKLHLQRFWVYFSFSGRRKWMPTGVPLTIHCHASFGLISDKK
jgi:hypothetical protein